MTDFEDKFWWPEEQLRLHYRDYPASEDAHGVPVICLHGLTRNARDFSELALRLSAGRRVIVPEMRGRGESGYARDASSYTPLTYVRDVEMLLRELDFDTFAVIGTSMGGIIALLMGGHLRGRMTGLVLNDIGPDIDPTGLARIADSVGQGRSYDTWAHAGRALRASLYEIYPDWDLAHWIKLAKRTHRLSSGGRIVVDYDTRIAEAFALGGGGSEVGLWPAFDALGDIPMLAIRGETSDILEPKTVERMSEKKGDFTSLTIAGTGHAPTLDEPEAIEAIDRFLMQLDERSTNGD